MTDLHARLAALPIWSGPIEIEPLAGGMTNRNLLIHSPRGRFVARVAGDNVAHGIDRAAEQAATRAAAEAGLAPAVIWCEPDLMVLAYQDGHTLDISDFSREATRLACIALLGEIARRVPAHYKGSAQDCRPIVLLRHYVRKLQSQLSPWRDHVEELVPVIGNLASSLAHIPLGFAHNDIHGGNLLDDGSRLWLVDWEYAGQGQPMMDLASLINNASFDRDDADAALALWLNRPPGAQDRADLTVMRLAAAMRDLLWGYAQDGSRQPTEKEADHQDLADYIAINQRRVAAAIVRLSA